MDRAAYDWAMGRKKTQPIDERTFGSTFVNPGKRYAARLIEECGLKGTSVGGAMISPKHANFIVNPDGRASAADVEALIDLMRSRVKEKFGVTLKTEVVVIGNR
jgi:UDP-N-acetylmuramate dehydrogenase